MRIMVVDPRPKKLGAYYAILEEGKVIAFGDLCKLQRVQQMAVDHDVRMTDVLIDCSTRRMEVYELARTIGGIVVRSTAHISTGDAAFDVGQQVVLIRKTNWGGTGGGEYGPAQDCVDMGVEYLRYRANLDEAGVVPPPLSLSDEQKAERYDALVEYIFQLSKSDKSTESKIANKIIQVKGVRRPC